MSSSVNLFGSFGCVALWSINDLTSPVSALLSTVGVVVVPVITSEPLEVFPVTSCRALVSWFETFSPD